MGARTQIAGLVRRGGDGGPDPALPDRAGAVPAAGGARRGDRLRGDRTHRPAAPGERWRRSTASRSRSPAVTTGCVVVFGVLEALVVAVGLSIIDTVRRSARPLRRRARLGRPPRRLPRRRAPPVGARDAGRRRLPARRPPLLRQRAATSRGACARRSAPHRPRPPGSSSTPRRSTHVDSTGIEALLDLTRDLRREEITLVVARAPHPHAAGLRRRRPHRGDRPEHFYPSVKLAVEAFRGQPTAPVMPRRATSADGVARPYLRLPTGSPYPAEAPCPE